MSSLLQNYLIPEFVNRITLTLTIWLFFASDLACGPYLSTINLLQGQDHSVQLVLHSCQLHSLVDLIIFSCENPL